MDAATRTRKTPATGRRAPRRPACSTAASTRATPSPTSSDRAHESSSSDGLKVTIKVIQLPDSESNPLRARQLAVIVSLLRRAAAEAAERDATSCDDS
jgi:hypothetical protein